MAEKKTLQEKVEDQLNCSICLDTYTNPKLLQCFHVYCQGCLVKLVVRDQEGHLVLTCPICRQVTPIPANGVTGLPPAFHINHLLEILEEHKKEEGPTAERELASLDRKNKDNQFCSEHDGKALELYCETCEELICYHCALKKGKHHSHDYALLDEAFEKYKEEITPSLEPMEKQLAAVRKALTQCDSHRDEISDQGAAVEANIHKTIDQFQKVIHEALEVRKTELIGQLHQMTQEKMKDLAVERDQIETTQAQLGSCIGFIKESFKTTSSQGDVLKLKATIAQRAKELTTIFIPDISGDNLQDAISLSTSRVEDITAMCSNCVRLSAPDLADPSKCYITGKGPQVAEVGEKSTVTLQAIDNKGNPLTKQIKALESEIVAQITAKKTGCIVERRGESKYEISYQPTIKGRHQLHIKVGGVHIRGSPFCVKVTSQIDLRVPIQTIKGLNGPCRLALNQRGEMIVCEVNRPFISVFSVSGQKLRSFSTQGGCPHGVAVDGDGNIVIACPENNCIKKFTEEGQFLVEMHFQQLQPYAIAFNSHNNKLYVSGDMNVHIVTSDFSASKVFNKVAIGRKRGVTIDSTGNVYIADCGNSYIQVFSAKGMFIRTMKKKLGELRWPASVAVGNDGVVFVSEFYGHQISMFDCNGRFMSSYEGFFSPIGLALDDCGVLYVCDTGNNCVVMF